MEGTLEKRIRYHNFDIIRLIAAIMVVYSHSFVLSGKVEPGALIYKNTFGGLGVAIFLMVSGFLVAQSWDRTQNIYSYMKARMLRILPGLFATIMFCVFIIGPLTTNLSLIDYFHNWTTVDYFKNITMYNVRYSLPGVFETNPYKYAVNGSLWTICYEFSFYIMLALASIGIKKYVKSIKISVIFLIIGLLGMQINSIQAVNIYSINIGLFIKLFAYFSVGFLYNDFKNYIHMKKSVFIVALSALLVSVGFGGLNDYGMLLFGAYVLFYMGTNNKYQFNLVSRIGDLSYGTYVYAFPIQQTVTYFYKNEITQLKNFTVSLIIIVIISYASWHLIEKRFLKLKEVRFLKGFG